MYKVVSSIKLDCSVVGCVCEESERQGNYRGSCVAMAALMP